MRNKEVAFKPGCERGWEFPQASDVPAPSSQADSDYGEIGP